VGCVVDKTPCAWVFSGYFRFLSLPSTHSPTKHTHTQIHIHVYFQCAALTKVKLKQVYKQIDDISYIFVEEKPSNKINIVLYCYG